jgi:hypothetical protein
MPGTYRIPVAMVIWCAADHLGRRAAQRRVETDGELDAFLAFVTESRHADLA